VFTLPVLVFSAVVALQDPAAGAQLPQDQARPSARSAQPFDQTIPVTRGTRVDLSDCYGAVTVKTWTRDAVQVRTADVYRGEIKAALTDKILTITQGAVRWPTGLELALVDFELLVPAWIDVRIEGRECGIEVNGVAGNVALKNSEGDIVLRGVGGSVDVYSIDGDIEITGGKGRIKAGSSDGDITITDAAGDIEAESIDGDVHLNDIEPTSVIVSTVDGDVFMNGPLQATGKYRFTSHDGNVSLSIPETTSATFMIRRYSGDLQVIGLMLKPVGDVRRGRRSTYTLGAGGAQVEIESFDGDVVITKAGPRLR
jgi:hypothetical protein